MRGKRIMRQVVGYFETGITRRGYPEQYWFIFECGHFSVHSHSAHWAVSAFAIDQGLPIKMHCDMCAKDQDINIPESTPLRIFQKLPQDIKDELIAKWDKERTKT